MGIFTNFTVFSHVLQSALTALFLSLLLKTFPLNSYFLSFFFVYSSLLQFFSSHLFFPSFSSFYSLLTKFSSLLIHLYFIFHSIKHTSFPQLVSISFGSDRLRTGIGSRTLPWLMGIRYLVHLVRAYTHFNCFVAPI